MKVNCTHWSVFRDLDHGGLCAHPDNPAGAAPSFGTCDVCPVRQPAEKSQIALLRHAAHAAKSIAKTTIGIDRASSAQVEARLNVCRACPGGHAVWKNGDIQTCGPLLESMRQPGRKTCGCVLRSKARDLKEKCPFGFWPEP